MGDLKTVKKIEMQTQNETNPMAFLWLVMPFLFLLLTTSCSDFLRGKPAKNETVELKSSALSCLDDVSLNIEKLIKAEATEADVETTFNCLDSTLTEFQRRVEGRAEATSFDAEDLYLIFDKFVAQDSLSRAAAQDILLLKAAIFGGDKTKITKTEISQLKNYLKLVKSQVLALMPYIRVFYFDQENKRYSKQFINNAFAQLNSSIKLLFRESKLVNGSYSFDDFTQLVINLKLLKSDQYNLVRLANKINQVLNGTQVVSSVADGELYINSITELTRLYSLYSQQYVQLAIVDAESLDETLAFADSAISIIENSLQFKKAKMISAASLDALLTELATGQFFPLPISASAAISFYKTVIVRLFENGLEAVPALSGVTSQHLIQLKRELAILKIYSRFIARIAGPQAMQSYPGGRIPLQTVQSQLRNMSAAFEGDILAPFNTTLQSQIINQVEEFKAEFLEPKPVLYRHRKMVVAANQNEWAQNWLDLADGLYVKMLSRLLIVGWGIRPSSKNIRDAYVSEPGMVRWYAEFKSFGIAMKIFDPRSDNLGGSSLGAANLFTSSGNGDKKMTFKETLENLGSMVSGSGHIGKKIMDDMKLAGCNLTETDVFANRWNSESCFHQVIRSNYKVYFASLSYFVAYLDSLNETQFRSFFEQFVDVVRNNSADKGRRVETSDINGIGLMVYFMESLYLVHDLNRNWSLSESEIKQGYPKFKDFATEFAYETSRDQLKQFTSWLGDVAGYGCFGEADLIRESFVFMVYHGRTPKTSDLHTLPCYRNKPLISFSGEVDRMRLLKAFKVIRSAL